ncbi:hypothetical protein HanIR_Chr16g0798251 [Helianthus annuus]|nr:hypothetical protein HanIR_Chr16g0798251 [Helianthus annuus]
MMCTDGFLHRYFHPQSFSSSSLFVQDKVSCSDDMMKIHYESCSSVGQMVVPPILIVDS